MQLRIITLLLLLIILFLLPDFLPLKIRKLFKLRSIGKIALYGLMASKSYVTLYIVSLMITNNILFSIILAAILLASLIFIIYLIWNLSPRWQQFVLQKAGFLLIAIISLVFIGTIVIFLSQININIQLLSLKIIWELFAINFYYALTTTLLIAVTWKPIAKFLINLKEININLYKKYLQIFHYFSFIPFIFYGFMGYFIINLFNIPLNLISLIFILSIVSLFAYLPLLIDQKINSHSIKLMPQLLIMNLYKGNNNIISMIYLFGQIFFEINIILPFFLLLKNQNLSYNEIYSSAIFKFKDFFTIQNIDYSVIYLYGFFILIFYSIFYFFSKKLFN